MMMDARHISICAEPDCPTCALTDKIMELLGSTASMTEEDSARRCTAIAHTFARTLFAYYRGKDSLQNHAAIADMFEWFGEATLLAMAVMIQNDTAGSA